MNLDSDKLPWRIIFSIGSGVNIINIICSSFVLVTLIVLVIYDRKAVDRISLRLLAGIAAINIINSINNLFHWTLKEGLMCTLNGFFRVIGRQLFCFLYIAITLNLQLIFLHDLSPTPRWELFYWAVPISVTLIMNIPPLALGMFGYSNHRCLLKQDTGYNNSLLVTINLGLILLTTFIYCSIVATLVMLKLKSKLNVVKNLSPRRHTPQLQNSCTMEQSIRRLIFRISLYPIACVASLFSFFILCMFYILGIESEIMSCIALLNQALSGVFNLVVFLLDPTLQRALSTFWNSVKQSIDRRKGRVERTQSIHSGDTLFEQEVVLRRIDSIPSDTRNNNLHLL